MTTEKESRVDVDGLKIDLGSDGVATLTFDNPRLNAVSQEMHARLPGLLRDLDQRSDVRVIVVRGEGKHFSAGGSFDTVERTVMDAEYRVQMERETFDVVHTMVCLRSPVVSAIEGVAVGAGLAVAILADVSIAGESARIMDGHTRLGVAAGDHAVLCWPLLCGMAKSKYHLLLCKEVSGKDAERMGLISECVEDGRAHDRALEVARHLASLPAAAVEGTKSALNYWYRQMLPAFELSVRAEMAGFAEGDVLARLEQIKSGSLPAFA